MPKLTRSEKQQAKWEAALSKAWLADHPGKTVDDYEFAGSCADTKAGALAYAKWFVVWMAREGGAIHTRIFKKQFK